MPRNGASNYWEPRICQCVASDFEHRLVDYLDVNPESRTRLPPAVKTPAARSFDARLLIAAAPAVVRRKQMTVAVSPEPRSPRSAESGMSASPGGAFQDIYERDRRVLSAQYPISASAWTTSVEQGAVGACPGI